MNGRQIEIENGSTVLIKLESLATSGYLWDYAVDDTSIIELKKKDNELQSPRTLGNGGMEVFEVKGLKQGTAKIFFSQTRKWEQGTGAIKSRYYTIQVK
ncbi:MAG TPA: protease inhibitor I42 family protein [Puia sp.]|nr:protease inhibitor I42 family protein [Puia sp.]